MLTCCSSSLQKGGGSGGGRGLAWWVAVWGKGGAPAMKRMGSAGAGAGRGAAGAGCGNGAPWECSCCCGLHASLPQLLPRPGPTPCPPSPPTAHLMVESSKPKNMTPTICTPSVTIVSTREAATMSPYPTPVICPRGTARAAAGGGGEGRERNRRGGGSGGGGAWQLATAASLQPSWEYLSPFSASPSALPLPKLPRTPSTQPQTHAGEQADPPHRGERPVDTRKVQPHIADVLLGLLRREPCTEGQRARWARVLVITGNGPVESGPPCQAGLAVRLPELVL